MDIQSTLKFLVENEAYVCKSSLLAGIPIPLDPEKRIQCKKWKQKAKEIEHLHIKAKQERRQHLIRACNKVEQQIKKKKEDISNNSCFDVNQNFYNMNTISNEKHNQDVMVHHMSVSKDISTEFVPDNTEKIDIFSRTNQLNGQLFQDDQNLQSDDFEDRCQNQTQYNSSLVTDNINEHQIFTTNHHESDFVPEVEEQILELLDLRNQQEELDDWYVDMQRQLDLEKVKLAEKYDQLKLQNIRKQKSIIENSEDFLRSSMHKYTPQKIKTMNEEVKSPTVDICPAVREEEENEASLDKQKDKNSIHVAFKKEIAFEAISDFKNSENYPEPLKDKNGLAIRTLSVENENVFEQSPDPLASKALGSELLVQHYHSVDLKLRRKSKARKFFGTPDKKDKDHPLNHSPELPLNCEKEYPTNAADKILQSTEEQPIILMKEGLQDRIDSLIHTPNLSNHHSMLSKVTSTPHDDESGTPYYSLSHIYADELPVLDYCNEMMLAQEESNIENTEVTSSDNIGCSKARLFAAYQGFMVRRLMNTYKANEILKTIKDTQMFLSDMDKENGPGGKNVKMSLADKQLHTRLTDELSTKRRKLVDIFLMSKKEQWQLIKNDRLHQEEKRMNAVTKSSKKQVDKQKPKTVCKKLSTASQKSMKRRQEITAKQTNRPKTAPVKTSTKATKPPPSTVPNTNKSNSEARALKPIQSTTSPTMKRRTTGNILLNSLKKNETKNKPGRFSSAQV